MRIARPTRSLHSPAWARRLGQDCGECECLLKNVSKKLRRPALAVSTSLVRMISVRAAHRSAVQSWRPIRGGSVCCCPRGRRGGSCASRPCSRCPSRAGEAGCRRIVVGRRAAGRYGGPEPRRSGKQPATCCQEISGGLDIVTSTAWRSSRAPSHRPLNFKKRRSRARTMHKMVGSLSGGERGRPAHGRPAAARKRADLLRRPSNDLTSNPCARADRRALGVPRHTPRDLATIAGSWTASPYHTSPSRATRIVVRFQGRVREYEETQNAPPRRRRPPKRLSCQRR
ncbi:hypothetical protein SB85_09270 [Xanthomonas sacchari]|nr:hypothetical protein SB85_09270 [Xanthomonas sacchari]